jgi:hypothetical protein
MAFERQWQKKRSNYPATRRSGKGASKKFVKANPMKSPNKMEI